MSEIALRRLSPHDSEPLYAQIMHILEQEIREGRLRPGDKLATQEALAAHFGVSLAPVKQALRELEERGIVSTRQGRGTYVLDATPLNEEIIDSNRIPCFTREMNESGRAPGSIILTVEEMPAGQMPRAAEELAMGPDGTLIHVERVRKADNNSLSLQSTYFPCSRVSGMVERGIGSTEALSDVLRQDFGITIAASRQTITATVATPKDAQYLGVKIGSPMLLVERTSFLGTREPVEFVIDRRIPDFKFVIWLRRQ